LFNSNVSIGPHTEFSHEWDDARGAANRALVGVAGDRINQVLLDTRRNIDAAYARLQNAEAYVHILETQLGIAERWETGGEEYCKYKEETVLVDYREALDELERLVVQRLFELAKLGMSGTGIFIMSCY
jgi:hypothetical protein